MEESDWIARSQTGDAEAFTRLMQTYRRALFAFLLRLSGERALAEDALQDTLIKVWTGIGSFEKGKKFSSWLFQIAFRTAIDQKRRRKGSRLFYRGTLPESVSPDDLHMCVEAEERRNILHRAVSCLSPKQRQVFLLRFYGDMPFKEIAELVQEPLNTVLSRMNTAVKKLREHLRENETE